MRKKELLEKIRKFWNTYELKIVLSVGFILVSVLAFEVGFIRGQKIEQKPLVIEKVKDNCGEERANDILPYNDNSSQVQSGQNFPSGQKKSGNENECIFVGSKNSNKYHLPSCHWAKRIKPENIVCFKSAEDAVSKNYQPDKSCIK